MKWCCPGFLGHYESAGQRGFAVLVGRGDAHEAVFTIQSRAVEGTVKVIEIDPPGPVSLVTQTGLRFCPWCGANLERFYRQSVDALDRSGYRIEHPAGGPEPRNGA